MRIPSRCGCLGCLGTWGWTPHAIRSISRCLSSGRVRAKHGGFPRVNARTAEDPLGPARGQTELHAAACGAPEDLERQHVLPEFRPFSEEQFPSSRGPSYAELFDTDRLQRSLAGDAASSLRPNGCHVRVKDDGSHFLDAREDLLHAARVRCACLAWPAESPSSREGAGGLEGPRPSNSRRKEPMSRSSSTAAKRPPKRLRRK